MLQSGLTVLEERVNPLDTELLKKEHSAGTSLTMATIREAPTMGRQISAQRSQSYTVQVYLVEIFSPH